MDFDVHLHIDLHLYLYSDRISCVHQYSDMDLYTDHNVDMEDQWASRADTDRVPEPGDQ